MWSYDDVQPDGVTGKRINLEEYCVIKDYVLSGSISGAAVKNGIRKDKVKDILLGFKKNCPEQYGRMRSVLRIIGTKKDPVGMNESDLMDHRPKRANISDLDILEWLYEVEEDEKN